jgi:AGZA family xanthine/uracil permease-like MFS transporter
VVRKVRGAILIGIAFGTVLAIIVEAIFKIGPTFISPDQSNPHGWNLNVPKLPDKIFDVPDLGLLGNFSVLGAWDSGVTLVAIMFVFTLLVTDFFDTMGTMVAVGYEAGRGRPAGRDGMPPRTGRSCWSTRWRRRRRCGERVEQHVVHRVGRGCRRGRPYRGGQPGHRRAVPRRDVLRAAGDDRAVRGGVGRARRRRVPDDDGGALDRLDRLRDRHPGVPRDRADAVHVLDLAGIGAGFIAFAVLKTARGKAREVSPLMWGAAALFVIYFLRDPIEQLLS